MSLHFDKEPALRDIIEFRRREIFEELIDLLPLAEIEHVGSSSVPGGWTSGDVDVQVRVERDQFAEATKDLAGKFTRVDGGDGDLAVFKHEGRGIFVYLTAQDSPRDVHHKHRDLLREQPLLRERYDAIKRKFNGGDDAGYREAKDRFWKEQTA
jgi:GrpB-like predicted nucleotidyltransferase (UPF0157 family)